MILHGDGYLGIVEFVKERFLKANQKRSIIHSLKYNIIKYNVKKDCFKEL